MANEGSARIAFIGAGNHATQSLYPNLAHIPEFELVAVCDLVEDRALAASRYYGAPEFFTEVDAMLDCVSPQGVCICGPAEMHFEVGLQVLRRGVPIFVEKPPALTLRQAEELARVAADSNAWGMVGFMKRFAPANVVTKEFMAGETFGTLSSISLIHGCGPYDNMRRMLLFNGIHLIDLARYFAGDVASLFAYGFHDGASGYAVSATMQFASGAVGHLNMNSGHTWTDCFEQTYLSGTGAGILNDGSRAVEVMSNAGRFAEGKDMELFGWSNRYYVSGNMAGWASGGHYTRGYHGELQHFARAVLRQAEPTATLEDGVEALRMVEGILESIKSGKAVALSRPAD
ncbi:MAG: Gfo/Idh/MocA family oxidoreductase [Armatimonadetes bacterium]|nr:Gfo/Idh/MocA family oxidoreductase [Armatimonadota bacterium]